MQGFQELHKLIFVAMAKTTSTETPLMQQHKAIKARYPDAVLLFRVGDFYETFGQDAIIASRVLGITLTKGKTIHLFKRRAPMGVQVISITFSRLLPLSPGLFSNSRLRMVNLSIHR